MTDKPRFVSLDIRGSFAPALYIDTNVSMESLLETAQHRVDAARDLALAFASAGSPSGDGLDEHAASAAGLAIGILTSDAAAVMGELEVAFILQNNQKIKEEKEQ